MAATYPQNLETQVQQQKSQYIINFFADAQGVLGPLALPNNVYFRDIYFDSGTNEFKEVATGTIITSLPPENQFRYQPMGVQLLIRCLDYIYYP